MKKKFHLIFGAGIIATMYFISGSSAWAACVATCAVTEVSKIDFGTIQKPAAGSVDIAIAANTNAVTGTATVLYGTPTRGQLTLVRTGATTGCTGMQHAVSNVSTGDAAITLSNWNGWWNSSGGQVAIPWNRAGIYPALTPGTSFHLAATATVTSAANTGAITPSFDYSCTIY